MAHTIQRLPRGSDSQFGFAQEATYGTYISPVTSFLEVTKIGLVPNIDIVVPDGFKPGLRGNRSDKRTVWNRGGTGAVDMEVGWNGMGKIWNAAFGGTSTCVQQTGTIAYLETFTPGTFTTTGKQFLTIQTGIPNSSGAVEPWTYGGCTVTDWSVSCTQGGSLDASFTFDAAAFQHTQDLATPSYTSSTLVDWTDALAVQQTGVTLVGCRGFTFTVNNGLKIDRDLANGTSLRAIPLESTPRTAELDLDMEFTDITKTWDDFAADTTRAYVVNFTGGLIGGSQYYYWKLTIPEGHIAGDPPAVDNADIVNQAVKIQALDNGSDPLYKLEVMQADIVI